MLLWHKLCVISLIDSFKQVNLFCWVKTQNRYLNYMINMQLTSLSLKCINYGAHYIHYLVLSLKCITIKFWNIHIFHLYRRILRFLIILRCPSKDLKNFELIDDAMFISIQSHFNQPHHKLAPFRFSYHLHHQMCHNFLLCVFNILFALED